MRSSDNAGGPLYCLAGDRASKRLHSHGSRLVLVRWHTHLRCNLFPKPQSSRHTSLYVSSFAASGRGCNVDVCAIEPEPNGYHVNGAVWKLGRQRGNKAALQHCLTSASDSEVTRISS